MSHFFESIYQTVVINHNYVNVIYYSTFKKYNFKKSKLTLSLNIFEVVYIWQHEISWPRTFSFPSTTITVVSTHSKIFWMVLCFLRCLVYLGTQACLNFGLPFEGQFCWIPKFSIALYLAKIKKVRKFLTPKFNIIARIGYGHWLNSIEQCDTLRNEIIKSVLVKPICYLMFIKYFFLKWYS